MTLNTSQHFDAPASYGIGSLDTLTTVQASICCHTLASIATIASHLLHMAIRCFVACLCYYVDIVCFYYFSLMICIYIHSTKCSTSRCHIQKDNIKATLRIILKRCIPELSSGTWLEHFKPLKMVKTSDYLYFNNETDFTNLWKCSCQLPDDKQSQMKLIIQPSEYIYTVYIYIYLIMGQ